MGLTHDRRVTLLALAGGLPAVVVALVLLWGGEYPGLVRGPLSLLVLATWLGLALRLRGSIVRPLQTISNLLGAVREDDFSIRARAVTPSDALGHVMVEINSLAETLRVQRLGAQEATALLRAVMAEIDVAIFAFDGDQRLVLVNRYGERLLGLDASELLGRDAATLGLDRALGSNSPFLDLGFAGGTGRWEVRRTRFWQGGVAHELLVLADLSQPLREQEREAWKRLVRVISHELNNSLAPIKSIAGSLGAMLERTPPPDDWHDDMRQGLGVIASRAEALGRFTGAYARLARLPAPNREAVDFGALLRQAASLDTRVPVTIHEGPALTLSADADQLEQLLINVLRNAADAALETGGTVTVGWTVADGALEACIEDEGPGLPSPANLFVPFFTTKPHGTGIGLALSRQIAEAHGGSLTLENRADRRGARARLRIPVPVGAERVSVTR